MKRISATSGSDDRVYIRVLVYFQDGTSGLESINHEQINNGMSVNEACMFAEEIIKAVRSVRNENHRDIARWGKKIKSTLKLLEDGK